MVESKFQAALILIVVALSIIMAIDEGALAALRWFAEFASYYVAGHLFSAAIIRISPLGKQ